MSSLNPFSFIIVAWQRRNLILAFTRRKVASRYRGSTLGMLWAVLTPLLMLSIYTFVFSVIFQSRWGAREGGEGEFALFLYSGLILYTVFSECVNEAPDSMLVNAVYIKQHVFPSEVLAWVSVCSALISFAIGAAILTVFYVVVLGPPPIAALYAFLSMIPVMLWTLGAVWMLSSVGTYFRDLGQIVPPLTTALLFLSPIFYPASRVPEQFRAFYDFNPFVFFLESAKASLFYGQTPDWALMGTSTLVAWAFAWLGYSWFTATKKGFADVL